MITQATLPFIIYTLFGLLLIIVILLIRNEIRLNRLLKGKGAKTLEDTFKSLESQIKNFSAFKTQTDTRLKNTEDQLKQSIQGIGVIRFNPFKGTSGSNQSFAAAFLDTKGDGVVLSSIYSREHVSIFAKPLENKKSEYELTAEEEEAIEVALLKERNN